MGRLLDTKLLGVFDVGGIVLTISPALQPPSSNPAVVRCWIVALGSWFFALVFGVYGYHPTVLRVGPNPLEFLKPVWLAKSPRDFRLWQLAEIADSFMRNHAALMVKADALRWALGFTAIEVLALAGALILARLDV
jgi:hypothetical protein